MVAQLVTQSFAAYVDIDMRRPSNLMNSTTVSPPAPMPADVGPPKNYLDLYGLSKPPFGGTPDSGNYILFGTHRRAFELLIEHVVNSGGLILLQGEEGIGKTQTLRSIAAVAAESGLQTIMVSRPPNGRINLMQLASALANRPGSLDVAIDDAVAYFQALPRKALLADDVDLMPADCVRLLLSLVQRVPSDPGGPTIVLSSSVDLPSETNRPDLPQLASLAADTVRLQRLGAAEIRQYIERSLWITGSTTRRLIAPDAMKVLITRAGGVPGTTNRLMEAVLTAGFARGDVMITSKTVIAAMGPPAIRPRRRAVQASDVARPAMQIVAIGLLVVGVSAFLYRGLSGQFSQPNQTSSTQAAASTGNLVSPTTPPLSDQPWSTNPAQSLPPELMAALMKRGDQSLGLGDIAAARLLYQRAAEAGNAQAATSLGETYDPNFAAPGSQPDPAQAADWYHKALSLGDTHAAGLLKRLGGR